MNDRARAALDWLCRNMHNPEDWDTVNYISELIEKVTPKKPDPVSRAREVISSDGEHERYIKLPEDYYECPVCGGFLGYVNDCVDEYYQCCYCARCGQAIDWEVHNDTEESN